MAPVDSALVKRYTYLTIFAEKILDDNNPWVHVMLLQNSYGNEKMAKHWKYSGLKPNTLIVLQCKDSIVPAVYNFANPFYHKQKYCKCFKSFQG